MTSLLPERATNVPRNADLRTPRAISTALFIVVKLFYNTSTCLLEKFGKGAGGAHVASRTAEDFGVWL